MKLLFLLISLTCCKAMAVAQGYGQIETGKTINTNYQWPYGCISGGYKYKWAVAESGMKTNGQEYYTLFYASVGAETQKRFFMSGNWGLGWTTCLPKEDRLYDPLTGEYKILSDGYQNKVICAIYTNAKVGYRFFEVGNMGATAFASCSYSWKFCWIGAGIRIGGFQTETLPEISF